MHICIGNCVSNLSVIIFGEKCLLKSLHSCVVIFSSFRVIVERSKTTFLLSLSSKSLIIGGSSLKHLKKHHTKLPVNSNLQHIVVSVLPHSVDQML